MRFLDHNYWSRIFRCRYLFARIDGLHPACIQLEAKKDLSAKSFFCFHGKAALVSSTFKPAKSYVSGQ